MIVISTDKAYHGVERIDNSGEQKGNTTLVAQTMLVPKDYAGKINGKFFSNGQFQTKSYDDSKYVKATLGLREVTSDEYDAYIKEAENNGNTKGLGLMKSHSYDDYYIVTLYQDFQQQAMTLYQETSRQPDLLPNTNQVDASNSKYRSQSK